MTTCHHPDHDHLSTEDPRTGATLTTPIPATCGDCDMPIHYDYGIEDYVHDEPDATGCFLIPERPSDATACVVG